MKRSGFTMIELIFVIVILGILAAVAVLTLTATRADAAVAKISSNLATVVSDTGSRWTAAGTWPATYSVLTNVHLTTTPGGTTAATTLENAITAADVAAASAQEAILNAAQAALDACAIIDPSLATCGAEDANVTAQQAIYDPLLAAATIDPVYLNAGTNGITDACYSLALTILGDVEITALSTANDPVCLSAHVATLKNNMSAALDTIKRHSFGGTNVSN